MQCPCGETDTDGFRCAAATTADRFARNTSVRGRHSKARFDLGSTNGSVARTCQIRGADTRLRQLELNSNADMIFTSRGQNDADSLGHAVDEFHGSILEPLDTAEVTWTELPLES